MKVHLLVSELYVYQNARCNDEKSGKNILFTTVKIYQAQFGLQHIGALGL